MSSYSALMLLAGNLTILVILCLIPIAKKIGLVDKPGGRKKHHGNTPLIGGISIFLVLFIFAFFTDYFQDKWVPVLWAVSILIFTGIIDDFWDLRPLYKLFAQIIAGILVIFITGNFIEIIAYLPSGNSVNIDEFGYLLTLVAIVGLINAFNMIDGIDGLATVQAILSIILIFATMIIMEITFSNDFFVIFLIGTLIGFLVSNLNLLPQKKVFLGDAGSMMLGFLVSWILISYTQTPIKEGLPPSMALWIVAIPVADTVSVGVRRILLKRSPFNPDRKHLHHICLRLRLSSLQTLAVICALSIFSYLIGLATYLLFGEIASIILFLMMLNLYYRFTKNMWRISSSIRRLFIKLSIHLELKSKN